MELSIWLPWRHFQREALAVRDYHLHEIKQTFSSLSLKVTNSNVDFGRSSHFKSSVLSSLTSALQKSYDVLWKPAIPLASPHSHLNIFSLSAILFFQFQERKKKNVTFAFLPWRKISSVLASGYSLCLHFYKYILLIMLLQLSHFPTPSLHSILHTPSLPHSPPRVHVHGSYL